ncbi:dienelactone hydrolase family protein [Sphaerotilus uruguayifluvii]|uniref:Carboxymethylenebutenolidase n=1 Tax=Sphaerotilus uruguayifluvii TaxID=2735897 RepID=A0ABX2FYF5_9BURK|nr:dienelactone hydrolase family protein [Leptothrix sp. C29]NRT55050.1 carboxymethylenebutenolidase [Leptothrix sp. C29]
MNSCTSRWTSLPLEDGSLDAFVALPPAGRGPGLLLLQEIFGVNAHIRGVAEQYALAGFVVIAPDLFRRQATRVELGYVGEDRERALTLMRDLSRDQAEADMGVALAALRAMPECTGRVGALGYCMGGRLAFAAAALCGVDAAVCYYGGGIAAQPDLAALAERITVPVQFHHAGHDPSIPPEAVAAVRGAMTRAPAVAQAEFHDYPQAQHGFNCWARAAHDPASAVLAQGRSLVFLSTLF